MKKISVFRVSGSDGTLPSMDDLKQIRDVLKDTVNSDFPSVVVGFNVTKQDFEIPDGAEIVVAPDVPLLVKENAGD